MILRKEQRQPEQVKSGKERHRPSQQPVLPVQQTSYGPSGLGPSIGQALAQQRPEPGFRTPWNWVQPTQEAPKAAQSPSVVQTAVSTVRQPAAVQVWPAPQQVVPPPGSGQHGPAQTNSGFTPSSQIRTGSTQPLPKHTSSSMQQVLPQSVPSRPSPSPQQR